MRSPSRVGLVHLSLALFAVALLAKSASVQLVQGSRWTASAQRQQSIETTIPAPRGDILDALGETMAQSRETVKLEVAPQDVRDLRKLRNALIRAGVPPDWAVRATDRKRKWVTLPGRYVALDVAPIIAMRGVHSTSMIERSYSFSEGTRRIVGRVDENNAPVDGIELALDTLLRGTPGAVTTMRDGHGRKFESPQSARRAPVQGNTVVLTINHDGEERIDAVECRGGDGDAEDGEDRLGGHHARQVRRAPRRGDDHLDAATFGARRVLEHPVGGAVRGHDAHLVGHFKFGQQLGGARHDLQVAAAAHDDSYEGSVGHDEVGGMLLSRWKIV